MAGSSATAVRQSKSAVIVLVDSSDEEECIKSGSTSRPSAGPPKPRPTLPTPAPQLSQTPRRPVVTKTPKRIRPTLLSKTISVKRPKFNGEDDDDDPVVISIPDDPLVLSDDPNESVGSNTAASSIADPTSPSNALVSPSTSSGSVSQPPTPINEAFATLISACRAADSSDDMEQLITKKLTRYYQTVHPDFVNSKSFSKTALSVAAEITAQPGLCYLKLSSILEELNIRRKSGHTVMANEESTSTGDAKKDFQIKRLNQALYVLKKKIAKLDEADVDLNDDDNSTYLLVERYKKRACEIYEKICDLTGESKHAHREVRKPIVFQGTNYPLFNKTITSFVNRTHVFPDLFDVLRCLEHCNTQYEFKLSKEEVKRIAQDAFIKIGKSLQKRRKNDLYETVSYFTGAQADPATDDTVLQQKLADNEKFHSRINEIIDRFADEQVHASDTKTTKASTDDPGEPTTHHNNNTINQNDSSSTAVPPSPDDRNPPSQQSPTTRDSRQSSPPTTSGTAAAPKTGSSSAPGISPSTSTVIFDLDEEEEDDTSSFMIPLSSSVDKPRPENGFRGLLDSPDKIVLSDDDDVL